MPGLLLRLTLNVTLNVNVTFTHFNVNFGHILLLFLVFRWVGVPPYQFMNAEITYCCNY